VAKVKKRTGVTGVRNVKASKGEAGPVNAPKANAVKLKAGRAKAGKARAGKAKSVTTKALKVRSRASTPREQAKPQQRRPRTRTPTRSVGTKAGRSAGAKAALTVKVPVVRVAVRELDPQRKCGDGTSVQFLYRVDETVDGRATAHLVFFDRHGWYCEHGRTCPAVAHARKHNGQFARVS
jgi:hypothetical protein